MEITESNPLVLLKNWIFLAEKEPALEFPTAMALATLGEDNQPQVRQVLYRGQSEHGIHFFTNFESPKSKALLQNPKAALCFFWDSLHRQVRVEGAVKKLPESISDEYFQSRPRQSQLGAWASKQSQILASRGELEKEFEKIEMKFESKPVPRPPFWGGFALEPQKMEFWMQGDFRLHDRFLFTKEGGNWKKTRLSP